MPVPTFTRRSKIQARRRRLLLTPVIVLGLALPASAAAGTFCVSAPSCPAGGVSTGGDLQAALDAAAAAGSNDQVLVGDRGSPYVGPFSYQPNSTGATNAVEIVRDGPGRPVLTAGVGETVLTAARASLDGIDVRMASSADGVGIELQDGRLGDVEVSGPTGERGATGVLITGVSTLQGTRVNVAGDASVGLIGSGAAEGATDVLARDVKLDNALVGISVATAKLRLEGSRVSAGTIAVAGSAGKLGTAAVTASRSALVTTNAGARAVEVANGTLSLDHVTVAAVGSTPGADALTLNATAADGSASLRSVAIAGYTRGIVRTVAPGRSFPLTIANSVWDASHDAAGGAIAESGDAHVAPALVDLAAGDLRPRGSSAAIDRDAATDPSRYTDLDGLTAVDGNGDGAARPDAGAFEYRRRAPRIDALDVPGSAASGVPARFAATTSDEDGDHVAVTWDFGDGAAASGAASTHAYAAPGTYRATATATDDAGLTDRRTFTVAVTSGAPPAGPTGTPPGAPNGGTPHRPALALRGVRLTPSRTHLNAAGRVRLQFSASESATIRIVRSRRQGRRTITTRLIVRHVGAGINSIALAAALRQLHLLKAGRVNLTVSATDASGQRTGGRTLRLTLLR